MAIRSSQAWLSTVVASMENPSIESPLGEPMPAFPAAELQILTTGQAGEATLKPAAAFYGDVVETFHDAGNAFGPDTRILDFGCGWGRITRFFLRDVPLRNLHGVDVDPDFVRVCRDTFGSDRFVTCDSGPPLDYPDASFDIIFAFSVFSHLSESISLEWMREFARLIRPGGLLAFTTRNEAFLSLCESLGKSGTSLSQHHRVLANLFDDWDAARETLRRGEFLHVGVSGGGNRDASFYGESFIPRSYVDRVYGEWFEVVHVAPNGEARGGGNYEQTGFFLKRR
jgi:SAM-dependent methyltransferase